MMNLFKLSEQLKDLSKDQLVQEMKAPSGAVPQFLVMSELQRRSRMEREAMTAEPAAPTTVAQDTVAAAGAPQGGLAQMAQALAPKTDMAGNTGIAAMAPQPAPPVQRMQVGGEVEGPNTSRLRSLIDLQRALEEARVQRDVNRQRVLRAAEPSIADVEPLVSDVAVTPASGSSARLGTRPPAPAYTEEDLAGVSPGRRPLPGPEQGPSLPRSPAGPVDEFTGLPDYMTDQYAEPPEDIRNPMRVIFGDEAIDAIPSRSRPESEPDALPMDTGDSLDPNMEDLLPPPREPEAAPGGAPDAGTGGAADLDRMYEQDRWLALARFGLGLMSSREPTLGGAIGEAGAGALDYMTAAREGMLDRRMQEAELDLARQRLALSAAGSTGPTANQLIQRLQDQQENLVMQMQMAETEAQRVATQERINAIQTQLDALLGLPAVETATPAVDARPGFFERLFSS